MKEFILINIEKVKKEVVERLKTLDPDKIILFGSYAYGTPNDESDIDLFLLKDDLLKKDVRMYQMQLQKVLIDIQKKYLVGIDLFVDSSERVKYRIQNLHDQFYSEIMSKGSVLYAK